MAQDIFKLKKKNLCTVYVALSASGCDGYMMMMMMMNRITVQNKASLYCSVFQDCNRSKYNILPVHRVHNHVKKIYIFEFIQDVYILNKSQNICGVLIKNVAYGMDDCLM